jgi:hypothetical protein
MLLLFMIIGMDDIHGKVGNAGIKTPAKAPVGADQYQQYFLRVFGRDVFKVFHMIGTPEHG